MIKGVTYAHLGHISYHSEHSDVPYSLNQFLGWDIFAIIYNISFVLLGNGVLRKIAFDIYWPLV